MARRTNRRRNVHTWTVADDVTLVHCIVKDHATMGDVAKAIGVKVTQLVAHLNTLKAKGLRLERVNYTKDVVAIGLHNPDNFDPLFVKAVNEAAKTCIARETQYLNEGCAKINIKKYSLAEDNTLKFFGNTKSNKQLGELLGRSEQAIATRKKYLHI